MSVLGRGVAEGGCGLRGAHGGATRGGLAAGTGFRAVDEIQQGRLLLVSTHEVSFLLFFVHMCCTTLFYC